MTDRELAATLTRWFGRHARDLPWREAGRRDAYRVLVSELMLQQTQVSRVVQRYGEFLRRFPTARALAEADEADVLAAWSGLGYYRRARLLQGAARAVVERHGGEVPDDPAALRVLPGVGRYTAGAVASIAFGRAEPIVDGNVARVLLRVHERDGAAGEREAERWVWERAGDLVRASRRPGVFNEALMELGATVCTPRGPRCGSCPLSGACGARRAGRQEEIPRPKAAAARKPLYVSAVLAVDGRGRRLVEQRGATGLWAGLWQAPSLERADRFATPTELADGLGLGVANRRAVAAFGHQTTHRDVRFEVWRAARARAGQGRSWRSRAAIAELALGTPQRRILLELEAG